MSADGLEPRAFALDLSGVTWSPDGQWIVGTRTRDPKGNVIRNGRLFLAPDSSEDWTDIGQGADPVWSPDGLRIVYSVTHNSGLEVMKRDGSERVHLTNGGGACWSRDGRHLALVASEGKVSNVVFVMASSGGERRALGEGIMPSWSPADDRLLFTRLGQKAQAIHPLVSVRSDGSDERVLAAEGWAGRWSPDGSKIAFLRALGHELVVVNADGSGERSLGTLDTLAVASAGGLVKMAHYSFRMPSNGSWGFDKPAGDVEETVLTKQLDPVHGGEVGHVQIRILRNQIVDQRFIKMSARENADSVRAGEQKAMFEYGVGRGLYELHDVSTGDATISGKQCYFMDYTTETPADIQPSSLYLFFPHERYNTSFIMIVYTAVIDKAAGVSDSSKSDLMDVLSSLELKSEGVASSALGINVSVRKVIGIGNDDAQVVYFLKLDEGESFDAALSHGTLVASTLGDGGRVLLLDAAPGTYVAVAAAFAKKNQNQPSILSVDVVSTPHTTVSIGYDPFAHNLNVYRTYFEKDLIERTKVTVAPGCFEYAGDIHVDTSENVKGKGDDAQKLFQQALEGSVANEPGILRVLTGNNSFRGSLLEHKKDKASEQEFLQKAGKFLRQSTWSGVLAMRLAELQSSR